MQDPFSWCLGLRWGVFDGGMLGAVSLDGGETRGLSEIWGGEVGLGPSFWAVAAEAGLPGDSGVSAELSEPLRTF